MSELRKDYTTPEQSKILLELGIPIESANIVYYHTPDSLHDPYLITEKRQIENLKAGKGLPCWSGGRLIELYMKSKRLDFMYFRIMSDTNMIDSIVRLFVEHQNDMDFSKLEKEG